jgi:7,8-dihydro-6-hydroxymethylpterin dimethyltransferase
MLSEIRKRVVETGVFGDKDMIPLPCNPESISIGYGLRNGCNVRPLTSLISQEQLLAVMPNTISPEKYPALREKFVDLFSLSSGPLNTSERVAEFLCCLPTFEVPDGLGYENVFRVTIVQFLDRFNFCVGNVKRSCIHFVTPQGQIIPFDTYNLFYRNGSIDGIRAATARKAIVHRPPELLR